MSHENKHMYIMVPKILFIMWMKMMLLVERSDINCEVACSGVRSCSLSSGRIFEGYVNTKKNVIRMPKGCSDVVLPTLKSEN